MHKQIEKINKPIVFQTWKSKTFHRKIEKMRNSMIRDNQYLSFLLFDNDEMDNSVEDMFSREICKTYFKLNHYAARSDFWRYLILNKFGGIYLDIDSLIVNNISQLVNLKKSILTLEPTKKDFIQWVLVFNKNDDVLQRSIELIVDNVNQNKFKNDVMKLTGPTLFTNAIKEVLGLEKTEIINASSKKVLNKLNSSGYLYIKNQQHDISFLFKHKYNHLLKGNKKNIFTGKSEINYSHWAQFQKDNELY